MNVGCEDDDGLLIVHPESQTCKVCSQPKFSMSMFASKADLEAAALHIRDQALTTTRRNLQDPWDLWKPSRDIA